MADKREYPPAGITEVLSSFDFIERGYNVCILGESDSGKSYLAKAIGIKACNRYNVGYFHSEELLESMVALKEQDYDKYARKMKKYLNKIILKECIEANKKSFEIYFRGKIVGYERPFL